MKKLKVIFIICPLLFCGCTFQTKHRGFVFSENFESEIANVKTTGALEEKLGSPQLQTIYGEKIWVYYGADENYHGPFPMTYNNKTVFLVYHNGAGGITKTKILHDSDLNKVKIAEGETPIPAAIELNALQELFNNVGRFTPAGLGQ